MYSFILEAKEVAEARADMRQVYLNSGKTSQQWDEKFSAIGQVFNCPFGIRKTSRFFAWRDDLMNIRGLLKCDFQDTTCMVEDVISLGGLNHMFEDLKVYCKNGYVGPKVTQLRLNAANAGLKETYKAIGFTLESESGSAMNLFLS